MPNIKISSLPPATLPLDGPNSFFEVQTVEAGVDVSRKVASEDLTLASGIAIEDEGVPLAALASTLNFVGAGVTASGGGGTKTITIPGAASTLSALTDVSLAGQAQNDLLVNVDGTNWEDTAGKLTYDPVTGAFSIVDPSSTDAFTITPDGTNVTLDIGAHSGLNIDNASTIRIQGGQFNLRDGSILVILDSTNVLSTQFTWSIPDFLISPSTTTEQVVFNFSGAGTNQGVRINRPLWFNEQAAAGDDTAGRGQFWVRDDVPNVPMFTDDAGTDFVLTADTIITPAGADTNVQFNNAGAFGGDAGFLWDGINLTASKQIIAGLTTDTNPFFSLDFATNSAAQLQWRSAAGIQFLIQFNDSTDLFRVEGTAAGTNLQFGAAGNVSILAIPAAGTAISFADVVKMTTVVGGVLFEDSLYVIEKAAADADIATQGQFWVRDDAPNTPMFTDDAGTDFDLSDVGAPLSPSYIVVGLDATLPNERFLSEGFAINLVDNGAGSNMQIVWDEAATPVVVTGSWRFNRPSGGVTFGVSTELNFRNLSDDSTTFLQALDGSIAWGIAGAGFGVDFMNFGSSFVHYRFGAPILISEVAAAVADVGGRGQLWVRDDTPNVLMFTDDVGTDFTVDVTAV